MDQALIELIGYLKDISPAIWEALIKQVYVEQIQYTIGAALFLLGTVACVMAAWHFYKRYRAEPTGILSHRTEYEVLAWVLGMIAGVLFVMTILTVNDIIGRVINPEYYAILLLLEALP